MEDLPAPKSRIERFLAKACGMDVTTPEPGPGIEPFLYAIAYNTTPPVAGYRTEEWLAYVQGVTPAKPLELEGSCIIGNQKVDVKYFAVAAGMPGATLPEKPQNRKEEYWEYIATHRPTPGVLKYATGTNITLTDVVRGIEELQYVYGDTFQQTYSGENLYNVEDTQQTSAEVSVDSDGWITMQYDNSAGSSVKYLLYYSKPLQLEADTDYAIVTEIKSIKSSADNLTVYDSAAQTQFNNSQTYNFSGSGAVSPGTYVSIGHTKADMSSATIGLRTFLKISAGVNQTVTFRISVLANTSVTPETFVYQPYTGGIPSPNPDYPQDIQVVTSTQVVSIADGTNAQNFTVDLGSTELCKIGDYQDYIYKSGDDWYVHKETKKIILDGTEDNWDYSSTYSTFWLYNITDIITTSTREKFTYSNNFSQGLSTTAVAQWASMPNNSVAIRGGSTMVGFKTDIADSTTAWETWLDSHNTILYYPLATPTDTKITDATLVGQLNAIDSVVLPKPNAYIEVSANSTNLPGSLKISYYGEEE